MDNKNQQKSITWLVVLIVSPLVLFLIIFFLEILVQFVFSNVVSAQLDVNTQPSTTQQIQAAPIEASTLDTSALSNTPKDDILLGSSSSLDEIDKDEMTASDVAVLIIRIIQIVLGIVAVILLFLEPLWITLLILRLQANERIRNSQQQLS